MRLLWVLLLNCVRLLLLPLSLLRRRFAAPRGAWLVLELDGPIVEIARPRPFWDRRPRALSVDALRGALDLASADPHVSGLLLSCTSVEAGAATAESVRQVLIRFRESGKPIVAYMPRGGGARPWLLASVAGRILVGTEALVEPLGFSVASPYLGEFLDRWEVDREVLARGRYKTAAEPILQRTMSESQREQLGAYLDVLSDSLVDALAEARKVEPAVARGWIDQGPFTAKEALAQGMCDAVLHPDEVAKVLDESREEGAVMLPLASYAARREVRFLPFRRRPYIAVLPLQGAIVSEAPASFVQMAEEGELVEACRRLWSDRRAQGVLLVVNSQGGSALASERIRRALERLGTRKPLVAYLSNVAASGGYLTAVAAPTIVAQPTTLTGSIGVIAARFSVGRVLSRLGVGMEIEKRGERADLYSPARTLTDAERSRLDAYVDDAYESFLAVVGESRKLERDQVHAVAQGRIWSGKDAQAHGLVDRLGGFDTALSVLRERLGEGAAALRPQVVGRTRARSPLRAWGLSALGLAHLPDLLGQVTRSVGGGWLPLVLDGRAGAYALAPDVDPGQSVVEE